MREAVELTRRAGTVAIVAVAAAVSGCGSSYGTAAPRTAPLVTVTSPAAAPPTLERNPVILPPRVAPNPPITRKPNPTPMRTAPPPPPPPPVVHVPTPARWSPPARTWVPSSRNGPDTLMRNTALDAGAWWSSGLSGVPRIDARPGGTGCGARSKPTTAISCGDGRVRWDTDRVLLVVAKAPYIESRPWVLVIASAHEVSHNVARSQLRARDFSDRQWEGLADCMAGAYISRRYRDVLSPKVEAGAYNAIWQFRDGTYDASDKAYGAGMRAPFPATPQVALSV